MGGWAARNDFYDANKPALASLVAGWVEVNDAMLANFDGAAETLQKTQYKDVPLADFSESMKFSKYYTSAEWRKLYADGTATKWLQQVTDFFAVAGNIAEPGAGGEVLRSAALPADRQGLSGAERMTSAPATTTSSSAPARPAACSPTGSRADPACRVLLVEAGHDARHFWLRLPVGYFRSIYDPRFSWQFPLEPEAATGSRQVAWPRGKALGGSSVINGLLYIRGQPADFDDWAAVHGATRLELPRRAAVLQAIGSATRAARASGTARAASSASPTCATTIRTARPGSPPAPRRATR